jgi:3-oxoacyl-[acyl-carrier-protein] synthase I
MMGDVVIVAHGARTPVGLSAESAAAAVRAGIVRVREHPFMIDGAGDPLVAAYDGRLEPALLGWERLVALATSALREAASKIGPNLGGLRLSTIVAMPEPRPGMPESDLANTVHRIEKDVGAAGVGGRFEGAPGGHAGVAHGLKAASERLLRRECDLVAVGGVDTYLAVDTLAWLEKSRRLARSGVRSGFHPGEGAAFLILATGETARRLGFRPLARIRGVSTCIETRALGKGQEVQGQGLSAAIAGAASDLDLPGERVDAVLCDINGERYRNDEWGVTVLRIQHFLRGPAYQCPAECWGDVGAASMALGCVLAAQGWARQYARGPRALVWAGSDTGLRGATVLEQVS